ncbi:MAG: UTP--glucose-1-phosphate uridylyltransferase [Candidatus Komeilibacteria bacterium CG_4_10_14_0_2_um_filter_37_10]|uniref:UTP--glucose-1-phosphate uridylyltransferase n=1 Tax=Candidatus Komeilibacteria bacterium CG_4_10_14_0_2_um_filter_37_10 TaxID=1974470 RepID=A0A2M7VGM7_9BACT|nr:MAG: UTP--glucose-1-phosphate uridylyltransferase [Candidatus Komeilibacteria bacterium CG_4_10_14_0_2_um_filter_37_10]PJA93473.1 MAG: UTP--glucose-1-phosphate uridylyltransferase [Candidatus Komeilibacteria bacterium CG_4_9_14_3_um_filter_37_5]
MQKIRKAVIPVAGLGTRFLPATKAQPKEMLTLVDKPIIQYIVEEAVAAGIEQIIFVTSQTKRAIEDHFDRNFELEYRLRQKGKKDDLRSITQLSELATFVYIRQNTPKGLGHAIATAEPVIGNEPFAVFLGDDIIAAKKPAIKQLMEVYDKYGAVVLAARKVDKKIVNRYGIIAGHKINEGLYQVDDLVEKPEIAVAPSNIAIGFRYILRPEIFSILKKTKPGRGGEIQITDALREYSKQKPIYALEFAGEYFDCGSKLGFLEATVHFGLQHTSIKKDFKKYLKKIK